MYLFCKPSGKFNKQALFHLWKYNDDKIIPKISLIRFLISEGITYIPNRNENKIDSLCRFSRTHHLAKPKK